MSEQWNFYLSRVDDKPASTFVDMGIRADVPMAHQTTMAYIRVVLNRPGDHGMTTDAEFDKMVEIEDRLTAMLGVNDLSVYVGRCTTNGCRDFYYYTADGPAFEQAAAAAMAQFPNYKFETGHRPDADWRTYLDFLYPNARNQQTMGNLGVLQTLAQHGDDHSIPRQIDHMTLLPSKQALAAYVAYLEAENFTVRKTRREKFMRGRHVVDFDRVDAPTDIDDITLPLYDKAVELGGEYDGWGCSVLTGE